VTAPGSPWTDPFWTGIAAGELRLPHCAACDAWVWYPQSGVPHVCGRPLSWTAVPPTGTVYATTTVRRPFLPGATRDDVPVTTILVELDHAPGVRLVARVEHGAEASVGTHVAGRFVSVGERMDLRFEPC